MRFLRCSAQSSCSKGRASSFSLSSTFNPSVSIPLVNAGERPRDRRALPHTCLPKPAGPFAAVREGLRSRARGRRGATARGSTAAAENGLRHTGAQNAARGA